ncbi:MAG: ATP-binding protein [Clostridiales bacterium]|nr:ATP-binding protein [Clostridiales bacterium]
MLKKFKVRNFKNFLDDIELDLGNIKNYEFNEAAIRQGIIKDAIIYGINASGKTNLGYAILDLTLHLLDQLGAASRYSPYTNLYSGNSTAHFEYTFEFDHQVLTYQYEKGLPRNVTREILSINNNIIIKNAPEDTFVHLKGSENLNLDIWDNSISLVRYVKANTVLDKADDNCKIFLQFWDFISKMLWFSSTEGNRYIGANSSNGFLCQAIAELDQVDGLQEFLNDLGIRYRLKVHEDDEGKNIYCIYGNKVVPFTSVWSSGTRSAVFFYLWYCQIRNMSFLYVDEFDAFYHYEMAEAIFRKLLKEDVQVIVTSHNTDLITNDLLRPDCYFEIQNNSIKSFSDLTPKALRQAHNIQKMYKAGAFHENC